MLLSIIIPTFNRKALIKYTLDSLANQFHAEIDYEVIVIDDHSLDGTSDFITAHYPSVILATNPGKGAPSARNYGLRLAKGTYIMYLDSDDLVANGYFNAKLDLLEKNKDLDACYGEYDFFESDVSFHQSQVIFKHKYPIIKSVDQNLAHLLNALEGNYIPPLAIIWKREFLIRCNGHDESLVINQDVDLFIRAIFNGVRILGVSDNTKVFVRNHALDTRVGDPNIGAGKWWQILEFRKRVFKQLQEFNYDNPRTRQAMSNYLFGRWRILRHTDKHVAEAYLEFARQVHWPPRIGGGAFALSLVKILGPVNFVNFKFFLLRRD